MEQVYARTMQARMTPSTLVMHSMVSSLPPIYDVSVVGNVNFPESIDAIA